RKLIKAQKDLPESKLQDFNKIFKSQQLKLYPVSGSPFEASLTIAPAEIGAEVHLLWLIRDITSRKQAEKVNTDLLHRLVTIQEDQISRISRELHDQTGQKLTALILGLKNLENMEPEAIKPSLKHLQELADEIGQEVHQFSFALRPTALDDLNLTSVLANYTEEWSGRNLVEVDYQANIENDLAIPGAVKLAVYRIVLEALNNISRHAHASRVSLILTQNEKQFITIIEDDGSGFDLQNVLSRSNGNKHLGLLGMRERTQLVGGSLQIESEIGKGTSLFIKIPLVNGAKTKS
ncbi:MAG: sensor histidine kinase, partial [Omnitrophica WOR_2 bacterium]